MSTTSRVLGGRYELEGILGQGGMADVYLATDRVLGRRVAVKVLRTHFARDAAFVLRFRREAQAAAALNDPNVVGVYDTGSDDGTHFIVMEYVQGRTLAQVIRDDGPLPPHRAAEVAAAVASGLSFAHKHGIVHRDVKPANVMITPTGAVKVMDFGIARAQASDGLTQTATVLGTATYFSPEQAEGKTADARSDIYSVGVVLYEMLTGKPTFTGESAVAVAYKHVREEPTRPSRVNPHVPPALEAIAMKCLAKNPDNRYQTADELAQDLERFLAGSQVAATPLLPSDPTVVVTRPPADRTGMLQPVSGPPTRRRSGWLVAAVVVLLLAVLGVGLWILARNLLSGATQTAQVVCPTNVPAGQTLDKLAKAGFATDTRDTPSDTVAQGDVIGCDPRAGSEQTVGTRVTVFVSSGKAVQIVAVPDVTCLSVTQAKKVISARGLVPQESGTAGPGSGTCTTPGLVARTDPPPGTQEPQGTQVFIFTVPQPTTTPPPTTTSPPTTTPPTTPPTTTPAPTTSGPSP